eukprot:5609785-Prymnesium_polylepis.2
MPDLNCARLGTVPGSSHACRIRRPPYQSMPVGFRGRSCESWLCSVRGRHGAPADEGAGGFAGRAWPQPDCLIVCAMV